MFTGVILAPELEPDALVELSDGKKAITDRLLADIAMDGTPAQARLCGASSTAKAEGKPIESTVTRAHNREIRVSLVVVSSSP